MADISQVKLPNGDTYNLVDETSGNIKNYTETDPVFSASAAAGITSTDISNWNGKSSTDEKLKITVIDDTNAYYLICGDSTTTATRLYDPGLSYITLSNHQQGYSRLQLGNGTPQGTSGAKYGCIRLYGTTAYATEIKGGALTTWRTITTPDKSGTIALTSDIPEVYSSTNTGGYLTMATLPIYDGTVEQI